MSDLPKWRKYGRVFEGYDYLSDCCTYRAVKNNGDESVFWSGLDAEEWLLPTESEASDE